MEACLQAADSVRLLRADAVNGCRSAPDRRSQGAKSEGQMFSGPFP